MLAVGLLIFFGLSIAFGSALIGIAKSDLGDVEKWLLIAVALVIFARLVAYIGDILDYLGDRFS